MLSDRAKDRKIIVCTNSTHTASRQEGRARRSALFRREAAFRQTDSSSVVVMESESLSGVYKPGRWHPDSPTHQR